MKPFELKLNNFACDIFLTKNDSPVINIVAVFSVLDNQ